jgi:hypothetical protein
MGKLMSIAFAVALAACATTAPQRAVHTQTDVDFTKVGAVEARALATGIDVIWVHPPAKR